MAAPNPSSASNNTIKLIIFSFDQVLTKEQLFLQLNGGKEDELAKLSDDTLTNIFGGIARKQRLIQHFHRISIHCHLAIVSSLSESVTKQALKRMKLLDYFPHDSIIGCDSNQLNSKEQYISNFANQRNLASSQIMFIDNDEQTIKKADKYCKTLHIRNGNGMSEQDMQTIENKFPVNKQHVQQSGNHIKQSKPKQSKCTFNLDKISVITSITIKTPQYNDKSDYNSVYRDVTHQAIVAFPITDSTTKITNNNDLIKIFKSVDTLTDGEITKGRFIYVNNVNGIISNTKVNVNSNTLYYYIKFAHREDCAMFKLSAPSVFNLCEYVEKIRFKSSKQFRRYSMSNCNVNINPNDYKQSNIFNLLNSDKMNAYCSKYQPWNVGNNIDTGDDRIPNIFKSIPNESVLNRNLYPKYKGNKNNSVNNVNVNVNAMDNNNNEYKEEEKQNNKLSGCNADGVRVVDDVVKVDDNVNKIVLDPVDVDKLKDNEIEFTKCLNLISTVIQHDKMQIINDYIQFLKKDRNNFKQETNNLKQENQQLKMKLKKYQNS